MIRLILLLLLLSSPAARANFFYRADTRPPDEVFRTGFTPWGNDASLFLHVVGLTCQPGDQTTGFVATTTHERFAIAWGRNNQPNGTHYYVYRIRSNPHFFNAARSLFHATSRSGDLTYAYVGRRYLAEGEWVTRLPVPGDDVVEAIEYISGGPNVAPERGLEFINPVAADTPGPINHQPYEWNYRTDGFHGDGRVNVLCQRTCLTPSIEARIRYVRDTGTDDADGGFTRKANHVAACRTDMALVAKTWVDLFDDMEPDEDAAR